MVLSRTAEDSGWEAGEAAMPALTDFNGKNRPFQHLSFQHAIYFQ